MIRNNAILLSTIIAIYTVILLKSMFYLFKTAWITIALWRFKCRDPNAMKTLHFVACTGKLRAVTHWKYYEIIKYDLVTCLRERTQEAISSNKLFVIFYTSDQATNWPDRLLELKCTLLCKFRLHGDVRLRLHVHYLCTGTAHRHMCSIIYMHMYVDVCMHVCPCVCVSALH